MLGPPTASSPTVRFSLIIVTRDRPAILRVALESGARALPTDGEVIVVDGDTARSAESVVRKMSARFPDVDMRYLPSAPGITLQRNVGIDAARGDVVVFVDDDCTFERGLFEALASAYRDRGVVGATGRVEQPLERRLGSHPHSRLRWVILGAGRQGSMSSFGARRPITRPDRALDVEFMPGPLMSARRNVAADVRFDERLTAYPQSEDDDFSYRVSRRGRIRYEPSAVVYHEELGRHQMDRRQMDRMRVINGTYLFRKNFSQTLHARAGFTALLIIRCVHRLLSRDLSGLRGLVDGMRHVHRSEALLPEAPHVDTEYPFKPELAGAIDRRAPLGEKPSEAHR